MDCDIKLNTFGLNFLISFGIGPNTLVKIGSNFSFNMTAECLLNFIISNCLRIGLVVLTMSAFIISPFLILHFEVTTVADALIMSPRRAHLFLLPPNTFMHLRYFTPELSVDLITVWVWINYNPVLSLWGWCTFYEMYEIACVVFVFVIMN